MSLQVCQPVAKCAKDWRAIVLRAMWRELHPLPLTCCRLLQEERTLQQQGGGALEEPLPSAILASPVSRTG